MWNNNILGPWHLQTLLPASLLTLLCKLPSCHWSLIAFFSCFPDSWHQKTLWCPSRRQWSRRCTESRLMWCWGRSVCWLLWIIQARNAPAYPVCDPCSFFSLEGAVLLNSTSNSCLSLSDACCYFTEVMVKGGFVQMREPGSLCHPHLQEGCSLSNQTLFYSSETQPGLGERQSCLNVASSGAPQVQTEQRFQFDLVGQESFHQAWKIIPRIHQECTLPSPLPLPQHGINLQGRRNLETVRKSFLAGRCWAEWTKAMRI